MRVYAEVKFLAASKQSFTSKEGEYVVYYENTLKGKQGVVTLNSKADYTECEGKEGIAEIEAGEQEGGKGYKLTLKAFTVGETLDMEEDDIE